MKLYQIALFTALLAIAGACVENSTGPTGPPSSVLETSEEGHTILNGDEGLSTDLVQDPGTRYPIGCKEKSDFEEEVLAVLDGEKSDKLNGKDCTIFPDQTMIWWDTETEDIVESVAIIKVWAAPERVRGSGLPKPSSGFWWISKGYTSFGSD